MFEAVELGQSLTKEEYKAHEKQLRTELLDAQRELKKAGVALLVIINGVEAAGKGDVVNCLNKWFDSRNLATHAFWDETDEELSRPYNWRYWKVMPGRGDIAIMFGGWYQKPLFRYAASEQTEADFDERTRKINDLEKMLHEDGMLIVKLWLHLSEDEHNKRVKNRTVIEQKPRQKNQDLSYSDFIKTAERMIRHSDNGEYPWQLIESDNPRFRDISAGSAILARIKQALTSTRSVDKRTGIHELVEPVKEGQLTILDHVDLSVVLGKKIAQQEIEKYQQKLIELSWQAYAEKRSIVIVFEGWDAAGKGGAIRRLSEAIDARLCNVISIAAPTDEEKDHHYLWRFWRHIPRDGYMTIYDRSWYGRVLVERVEGFAEKYEWMRSYREINDFEEQLNDHGAIVIKFWMHISFDEQLKRFKEREVTEWKKHKITEEDWRNREKWHDYWQAVNDMVEHTSTSYAPWYLVPSNDKPSARVEVIKRVCERIEQALKRATK